MKIVMTNTIDHTRKVVSFNEVCNSLDGGHYNAKGRLFINFRLLNNEVIKDGNYEFKREVGRARS